MSQTLRIGFQGEPGAFSESAVRSYHSGAEAVPRATFQDVVDAVVGGEDQLGMIPVENSLAGGVTAAWDVLAASPVQAIAEVVLPVRLCLLALPGTSIDQLRETRSHPVALAQCGRFLKAHPRLRPVAVHDTAGAAREVAALADPVLAAIASRDAGDRYGLDCLAADIQDRADNQTRFFVVGRADSSPPAARVDDGPAAAARAGSSNTLSRPPLKTALVAETDDRPGALRDLLSVFADRGLDLAHIVSRPGGTPWTYAFVIEVRHFTIDDVAAALHGLRDVTRYLKVIGTFPAASAPQ